MFKDKTAKKRVTTNKDLLTLDAMHNKIITNYSNKILEEKKNIEKIRELENIYNNLNNIIVNYNYDGCNLSFDNFNNSNNYYNELWNSNIKIKEEIIKIKEQLNDIKNFNEIEYYEKTSYILFNYYDMIEKQSNNSIKNNKFKNKSIIESFNLDFKKDDENENKVIEKSSLVDEYLAITNNNHIRKIEIV